MSAEFCLIPVPVMMSHDSTPEPILNSAFARVLREQGLDAHEEQTIKHMRKRHVIDVLVSFSDHAGAIEAKYSPGNSKLDAEKRIRDTPLMYKGKAIEVAFAVRYPGTIRSMPPADAEKALRKSKDLVFARRTRKDKSWEAPIKGSVQDFSSVLHNYWMQSDTGQDVDYLVGVASNAIRNAADALQVGRIETGESKSDPASTKALVWLNALLYHHLLSSSLETGSLPAPYTGIKILPPTSEGLTELKAQWEHILKINWWPIFNVALESMKQTPAQHVERALSFLLPVAERMAASGTIRKHDVAGRIFHRLLETRKFLATNYTTIPAAIILAALAFDPNHPTWKHLDFNDPETLRNLKIVDPACGSGTLLMAAFQEIAERITDSENSRDLTKIVLENTLYGFDVVPAAIHLAACTLSMAETSRLISDMNLWRMRNGVFDGEARLGSLDMLESSVTGGNAKSAQLFAPPPFFA